jgi:hypothetical protein
MMALERRMSAPDEREPHCRYRSTLGALPPAAAAATPMTTWGSHARHQAPRSPNQIRVVWGAAQAAKKKRRPKASHMNPKDTAQALRWLPKGYRTLAR